MKILRQHPDFEQAAQVYHTLNQAGYRTLFVGGCVRDAFLGCMPQDLDLVTEALPEQVDALFKKTLSVGKKFLISMVVIDGKTVEVATFRSEEGYGDGRRPDVVKPATAEKDARRRDFTVNGLFYDLNADQILDFVDGVQDLKTKRIRAIGDPDRRFAEDHLRLLRAVRFVGQLDFSLDPGTALSIQTHSPLLKDISRERKTEEFRKILKSPRAAKSLNLARELNVLSVLFPQVVFSAWSEDDFKISPGAQRDRDEPWPWLALFWPQLMDDLGSSHLTSNFVLNRSEIKLLQELKLWSQADKNVGSWLARLSQPSARLALDWLLRKAATDFLKAVDTQWQVLCQRQELPTAWIQAQDLQPWAQGELLGRVLQACYWAQLEAVVNSREQALVWCQDFLKKQGTSP